MAAQGGQRRVLVVDDDDHARAFFSRLLTVAGYEVQSANSGDAARSMLGSHRFDLVISDICMPGMTGIELLATIRQHDAEVPVVLVTGEPHIDTAVQAVQYGAFRYLKKPVPAQELIEVAAFATRLREESKRRRRNSSSANIRVAPSELSSLGGELSRSIGSLWIAYHPIVNCRTRMLHGYEALVRSNDGFGSPEQLLTAAEKLGRVHELGRAIRGRITEALDELPYDLSLFINLHPRDLEDEVLYDETTKLSEQAHRVVLEVTERASLDAVPDLKKRLSELRDIGFRFAIDDLGAGYAGLNSFVQLMPDLVKIDMALVRGVEQDKLKQRLIRSVQEVCADMGALVVAEGVETAEERETLVEMDVDLLQGYAFGRPAPGFSEVPPDAYGEESSAEPTEVVRVQSREPV